MYKKQRQHLVFLFVLTKNSPYKTAWVFPFSASLITSHLMFYFSSFFHSLWLRKELPVVVQHDQSSEAPAGLNIPEPHPSHTCGLLWLSPGVLAGWPQRTMCLLKLKMQNLILDSCSTSHCRAAWLTVADGFSQSPSSLIHQWTTNSLI